jgi:thiol-disulfide isomerase/thioredoxin
MTGRHTARLNRLSAQAVSRISTIFLLVIILLIPACEDPPPPLKVRVGQPVPALAAQDLFNQPARIQPSPGKLLMLNVWATWCGPCRHEMPSLQRLVKRLGAERLELVGLSVDMDEHVVREYLIENKIDFPSFLDRNLSEVNGVLGVRVFPSTFFVSPEGRLLKVVEGWRDWDDPALMAEVAALLPPGQSVEHKPADQP